METTEKYLVGVFNAEDTLTKAVKKVISSGVKIFLISGEPCLMALWQFIQIFAEGI